MRPKLCLPLVAAVLLMQSPVTFAQDILRIEMEASNLALPYYTIPAGQQGVIIFRGIDIKNRRISTWEIIHYNVHFKEVSRNIIHPSNLASFAGWEISQQCLALLFLGESSGFTGEMIIYDLEHLHKTSKPFSYPDYAIQSPAFILAGNTFYLCGMRQTASRGLSGLLGANRTKKEDKELLILTGKMDAEIMTLETKSIPDLHELAFIQPDFQGDAILIAWREYAGKYSEMLAVGRYRQGEEINRLGMVRNTPEHYLIDFCFVRFGEISTALAGTYGSRDKRSWRRNESASGEGIFFARFDTTSAEQVRYYPFTSFRNFALAMKQNHYRRSTSSMRSQPGKGKTAFRILLHETPYEFNNNLILVGESYYPEYEYENRTQYFPTPYYYYGYYPGFYDTGGRWVFKGFRYEYAIVVAFDEHGRLVWENGFETSNILNQTLTTRLSLLPYADEAVLVYANEGRIWYRVIRGSEVLVDKESSSVELPSPAEKVREHYAMNMKPWYDSYFLVWGRQAIRGADGRSRTVFYCNKVAFE